MNGTPVGKHLVLSAEAVETLRQFLQNLASDCGALAVLTVDRGGQLIVACGDTGSLDTTSLAALITGTFGSTRAIADTPSVPSSPRRCPMPNAIDRFSQVYNQVRNQIGRAHV